MNENRWSVDAAGIDRTARDTAYDDVTGGDHAIDGGLTSDHVSPDQVASDLSALDRGGLDRPSGDAGINDGAVLNDTGANDLARYPDATAADSAPRDSAHPDLAQDDLAGGSDVDCMGCWENSTCWPVASPRPFNPCAICSSDGNGWAWKDKPCPVNAACNLLDGQCQCQGTWQDCANGTADGCETDTATNSNHCGGCNTSCGPGAEARASCVGSICTCDDGWDNCNGDWQLDGCEVDLGRRATCGSCDNNCGGDRWACYQRFCVYLCQPATCHTVFGCTDGQGCSYSEALDQFTCGDPCT